MSTNATVANTQLDLAHQGDDNDNKFLTYCLGDEEYGVEILKVREIIGIIDITPLPQMPDYIKGVINLRGRIIPVIELRTKFGMPSVSFTEETCVIVVEVTDPNQNDHFQMGVIVDTVSEVLDISSNAIEPAPKFGCSVNTEYILGMGKVKMEDREKVVMLLDIDKVLNETDIKSLSNAVNSEATEQATSAIPAEAA